MVMQQQDAAEFLIGVLGEINDLFTSQRSASKVSGGAECYTMVISQADKPTATVYLHQDLVY